MTLVPYNVRNDGQTKNVKNNVSYIEIHLSNSVLASGSRLSQK